MGDRIDTDSWAWTSFVHTTWTPVIHPTAIIGLLYPDLSHHPYMQFYIYCNLGFYSVQQHLKCHFIVCIIVGLFCVIFFLSLILQFQRHFVRCAVRPQHLRSTILNFRHDLIFGWLFSMRFCFVSCFLCVPFWTLSTLSVFVSICSRQTLSLVSSNQLPPATRVLSRCALLSVCLYLVHRFCCWFFSVCVA